MRILTGAAASARVHKMSSRGSRYAEVEPVVRKIIADVRNDVRNDNDRADIRDRALRKYAEQWDGLRPQQSLQVPEEEIQAAWKSVPPELKRALHEAAANIRQFCEWQKPSEWTHARNGITVGQIVRPLDSVGCYVPGGRYPLVSTLLMTVIPAQVAGVQTIRVVSPQPQANLLAAAGMLGVREVFRIGGAQAVAALAYGTPSVPRVDKIVGPGNLYVTAAKRLVSFDCAIDFLAGPTETVIVSDTGTPEFIAADLVAQSEHDPEALAIFITTRNDQARQVSLAADKLSQRNAIARQSLRRSGVILVSASRRESFDWANELAPEHITVNAADVALVQNAGSVFVGDYSPQAAGDYASGPNHVLPTGGAARFRGGLGVLDFVKLISIQKLSRAGLKRIAPTVELLANAEGLQAHEESIQMRFNRESFNHERFNHA
jgi:histidinol dehydrogenase